MRERIGRQERLNLALLDREVEKIARIGAPIDILVGIDALLGELDREEILVGSGEIADGDDLALEIGELVDAGIGARQHPHAAAMGARGDLDVKALLQRLQPAQRHAEPGIALAGGDRFQQLVGRTAVIDEFDVEIVLLEKAVARSRPAPARGRPRRRSTTVSACAARPSARVASDAVLQIGNSEKSIAGVAARNGNACAPKTPSGAANAAAAPERNSVRRSSNACRAARSFDIILLLMPHARDHARATREARCRLAP